MRTNESIIVAWYCLIPGSGHIVEVPVEGDTPCITDSFSQLLTEVFQGHVFTLTETQSLPALCWRQCYSTWQKNTISMAAILPVMSKRRHSNILTRPSSLPPPVPLSPIPLPLSTSFLTSYSLTPLRLLPPPPPSSLSISSFTPHLSTFSWNLSQTL